MKTKICTSIEQSKKLIEIGIDVNTADMFWDLLDGDEPDEKIPNCFPDRFDISSEEFVPAWSLPALLELIPYFTLDKNNPKYFKDDTDNPYNCFNDEEGFMNYPTPLDSAFEMIIWFKENGKL